MNNIAIKDITIKSSKIKDFIKEYNKNVINKDFLDKCKATNKLIKNNILNSTIEITDTDIIKEIRKSLFKEPSKEALKRNKAARDLLRKARR